jgi:hypothetical protein
MATRAAPITEADIADIDRIIAGCEEDDQIRAEFRLRRHAAQLGFQLVPAVNQ